ncbi:MAG TPA: hypothetical protein VHP82_05390 [Gaiellaceae bacterium]|jgi:hypothetical protein|nr:hypothetical protein [Gaiellaceae bacterium]
MARTSKAVARLAATTSVVVVAALVLAGVASAAAPVNTAPPAISGTTTVGQTLTASNGTWSNSPTSFAYQWLRCNGGGNNCAAVANGTQQTYTLVGADAGHTLRVKVTATNADGSASAQSAQTAVVAPLSSSAAPKNTAPPTISGTPKVGQALTASPGSWSGNPTSFAYEWQDCNVDAAVCTNIAGATGTTYGVRLSDLGFRLRVVVTAKNDKGSATATSAPTAVVTPTTLPRNGRPTLKIISVQFTGQTVYARFRTCDDSFKNLGIIETDSRPGKLSYTRHFATLVPPSPCGVYTRHWLPAARFRGPGRFTITLRARDKSGLTSLPARRTFSHG